MCGNPGNPETQKPRNSGTSTNRKQSSEKTCDVPQERGAISNRIRRYRQSSGHSSQCFVKFQSEVQSTGNRQKYTYPEGGVYEGDWSEEGKKHGIGQLTFTDGTVFNGKFKDGLFEGLGTLIFPDNSSYQGEFSKGYFNGHGIYIRSDGMMIEGRFRNGKPEGPGLITFADGSHGNPRMEGFFEGTKLVKRDTVGSAVKKARLSASKATSVNSNVTQN